MTVVVSAVMRVVVSVSYESCQVVGAVTRVVVGAVMRVVVGPAAGLSQQSSCPQRGWQAVGGATCLQFVDNFQLTAGQASAWCHNAGTALLRFSDYDSVVSARCDR